MDYTKDAVLIHEGVHSFEDDSFSHDDDIQNSGGGRTIHHKGFDAFSLVTMRGNGSILPTSPTIDGDEYGDLNDTLEYIPYNMRPETYIVPVLFAIIFLVGVIGNGTLIVIFLKHRSMRNVPNMFIFSLCVGDILVILFVVPFTSTMYTVDSWPYGLIVCKFSEFIKDLSVGVSVFTLTALSADRYFAIVDPMRKLTGRRATRITIISIVGIWILSILVALPSALYSYIRVFPEYEEGEEKDPNDDGRTFQVCYPFPKEFGYGYAQAMVMGHFLVYYFIPMFLIGSFYILMAYHLVLSTRNMPGEAQGQLKQIQARKKVAKMILSFVVIFAICFFPHHLFFLWFYFYPDSENSFNLFWNICRIVGFCLSFMNSCINPITLYCVSGTFRKQFNDHLFCCFCDNSGSRPSRGARLSMGGTLAGGGGGHGGGLCAACVSLSGNNGQLHGNDSRYGNGSLGRGNGRLPRGSTYEYSDRMMSKRKSTWETQTTVVNHRILNIAGGSGPANIHVNLCSEQENIPLRNMNTRKLTAVGVQGTTTLITSDLPQTGSHHSIENHGSHYHTEFSPPNHNGVNMVVDGLCQGQGDGHNGKLCCKQKRSFNTTWNGEDALGHQNDMRKTNIISHPTTNYPSLIEEESEPDSGNKSSQLSPNKSYSDKVGEIFSKISNKYATNCNSPGKVFKRNSFSNVSENGSTPQKKSPTKVVPATSPASAAELTQSVEEDVEDGREINFYNNNNYSNESTALREQKRNTEDESDLDEYTTVTDYITVPESIPLKRNLSSSGKVIICYN